MTDRPVNFSASGPPETILDADPPSVAADLDGALSLQREEQHAAVSSVVARFPRSIDAWAALGRVGRDEVETYAAYRVGYHRGLDRLRANGWRGSGYVRWVHPENRGFLRCLHGLARSAGAIGEHDERDRCEQFLVQLDPDWPPNDVDA